jgi:hypothetical protein
MAGINWWAVLAAAIVSFLLGGPWYSKALFLNAWQREAGDTRVPGADRHPARVFGLAFLFSLVAAACFAVVLGPQPALSTALGYGLLAGGGMVAASFGINYQFANRSLIQWLIDGGYHTVQFLLFGLVLGLWH